MISARNQIITLLEQGFLPAASINDALIAAKVYPDDRAWRGFVDHLLLWCGGLALAFSALFFVAYNWTDMGRFAQFGLVECLIVLAIVAYWKRGEHEVMGKVSLLAATIFLGVLLALFGQTYQTGADPWQLFFFWALLILPWALIGRFPAIWVVWVVLVNLSIVLYFQAIRGVLSFLFVTDTSMLWSVFVFNTLVLGAWELLAKNWHWISGRWALRLLGVISGTAITMLALYAIFERRDGNIPAGVSWAAWLAVVFFIYRDKRPDLFMLAGGCLSAIVVSITFVGKHLASNVSDGAFIYLIFLVLALMVIAMGTGTAFWLRRVHRGWQS